MIFTCQMFTSVAAEVTGTQTLDAVEALEGLVVKRECRHKVIAANVSIHADQLCHRFGWKLWLFFFPQNPLGKWKAASREVLRFSLLLKCRNFQSPLSGWSRKVINMGNTSAMRKCRCFDFIIGSSFWWRLGFQELKKLWELPQPEVKWSVQTKSRLRFLLIALQVEQQEKF